MSPTSSPHDQLIADCALHYHLDRDLLRAQVSVESGFDAFAFRYEDAYFERYLRDKETRGSRYGPLAACSYGLLQIVLETALEAGFTDRPETLFIPRVGLAWGAQYLAACLSHTSGSYPAALARYNGRGAAASLYADRVLAVAGRSV